MLRKSKALKKEARATPHDTDRSGSRWPVAAAASVTLISGTPMKLLLLLALCGLGLTGCKKDTPAPTAAAFNQNYSCHFANEVRLPAVENPELTVTVADLSYSICPGNSICFLPDRVSPTLRIADAAGQVQQLTLPVPGHQRTSADWIDTTTVRANGRRYLFYFSTWSTGGKHDNVQKNDITVTLRVMK